MLPRPFIGDANGGPKSISGGRLPRFGRLPRQLISETAATGGSDDICATVNSSRYPRWPGAANRLGRPFPHGLENREVARRVLQTPFGHAA